MKIVVHDPEALTVSDFASPGFDIEGQPADEPLRALQLFAASLGRCTFKVVEEYGKRFEGDARAVSVTVKWTLADSPRWIDTIQVDVSWPGLPEDRLKAIQRVAARCTLHNTLHREPEVTTTVNGRGGSGA